jgi:sulfite reductase (NADPH) flavoprotein alpha-component
LKKIATMNSIPCIPESAPFTPEQRNWLNGFLAGLLTQATPSAGSSTAAPTTPLTILYGSQTGSAEGLAKKIARLSGGRGFTPSVLSMDQANVGELATLSNILVVTSTYGDGEPPDNAQSFWSALKEDSAPSLAGVRYAVLALGDTNYPAFCEFGKQCDIRFESLGATRIHPRCDCDTDYEAAASAWMEAAIAALSGSAPTELAAQPSATALPPPNTGFGRTNPFPARLVTNRVLNGSGSAKEVRHFEISLDGSGLTYEVGDALGVCPRNCPALVNEILSLLGCDGEEAVLTPDGSETSLRAALTSQYDILKPSTELLKYVAGNTADDEFRGLVLESGRGADLRTWLWGREVIDILQRLTASMAPRDLIGMLKKLQPRLYSISSSPKAHPGEVHLTVGAVRFDSHGRARKGVCSTFLADRAADCPVPVFVQTSHGFRLPADASRPVIMVGPGTGIAPFRAFLEERRETGATGQNWLFFGDQRRDSDFLYREELEAAQSAGTLHRLDLAFSRDQAEKIYVQHRMLEQGPELWRWLEEGAHFYVCGDASRMAKDVDAALKEIIQTAGAKTPEEAAEYLSNLKSEKRYQRDVY